MTDALFVKLHPATDLSCFLFDSRESTLLLSLCSLLDVFSDVFLGESLGVCKGGQKVYSIQNSFLYIIFDFNFSYSSRGGVSLEGFNIIVGATRSQGEREEGLIL